VKYTKEPDQYLKVTYTLDANDDNRSSAAEVSMCSEQIFGSDVDFISWDFGMTDGNYPARLFHYFYRAGLTPGRPAILGVRSGSRSGKRESPRAARLRELEAMGMAAFIGFEETYIALRHGIPDTSGMTDAEITQMPQYVRNFKCQEQLESGEPYCKKEKYTKYLCPVRMKQASWHPGM
jgi:hypothetical protein